MFNGQQAKAPCGQIILVPFATCRQPVDDLLAIPCIFPATARNNGHQEVADRLQAMCDRLIIFSRKSSTIQREFRLLNCMQHSG